MSNQKNNEEIIDNTKMTEIEAYDAPPLENIPMDPPCKPPGCPGACSPCAVYSVDPCCKITWVAANNNGCNWKTWTTIGSFVNASNKPTTAGDTHHTKSVPNGWGPKYTAAIPAGWGPKYTAAVPAGWNPPLAKNLDPIIAMQIMCSCYLVPDYNPVYAKANLYPGIGVGYNRSQTVIVNTDDMDKNMPPHEECPDRNIYYHLHVNRLTERIRINRSTK